MEQYKKKVKENAEFLGASFWAQINAKALVQRNALSLLLGFSMSYSTRSEASNVRRGCCWRDVILIRHEANDLKP